MSKKEEAPDHTRLFILFKSGSGLAYVNQRKLGSIALTEKYQEYIGQKGLGIDALSGELDLATFRNLLKGRRGTIKSNLMNQQLIAGIGNVYSDEILFMAGIRPGAQVGTLDEKELAKIHERMGSVFDTAIDRHADPGRMPDNFLLPLRQSGKKCPLCGGKIEKATIAGRSSYFCLKHQKD
jgi:formamidopyrimidine-DNA glycosylase